MPLLFIEPLLFPFISGLWHFIILEVYYFKFIVVFFAILFIFITSTFLTHFPSTFAVSIFHIFRILLVFWLILLSILQIFSIALLLLIKPSSFVAKFLNFFAFVPLPIYLQILFFFSQLQPIVLPFLFYFFPQTLYFFSKFIHHVSSSTLMILV